jgi:1,2-phenylacetyl-CoA epoxidase catalytic subunit
MNNEKLQAAKDQAAREYGHGDFQQALGYLVAGGDVMEFQDIEDRAMEIYAEMQIKAIKEYADSFHGSGHEYWFILGKIDDLIRHKLNQFKTTKP